MGAFDGCKVYYSGSMQGAPEPKLDLGVRIVNFIIENGGIVLSEHVPIADVAVRDRLFFKNSGIDCSQPDACFLVHDKDLEWVAQATHMVVLANASGSYGVGIEIQYASMKPLIGLNETPILVLRERSIMAGLSWMLTGKRQRYYSVVGYETEQDAMTAVSLHLNPNFGF